MNFMILIGILIVISGLIGGYANFHRYETNADFKWFNLRKSLLIGVVAASTVPLFLQMVSSNLLKEAIDDNTKFFVFVGFCLIAAFFSNRFLQSIADKVIKDLEDVKKKTEEIEDEAKENKEKVDELIDDKTDTGVNNSFAQLYRNFSLEISEEDLKKYSNAFNNDKFKFRTIEGISKESAIKIPDVKKNIETLKNNNIIIELKGKNQKRIYTTTEIGKSLFKDNKN